MTDINSVCFKIKLAVSKPIKLAINFDISSSLWLYVRNQIYHDVTKNALLSAIKEQMQSDNDRY